MAWFSVKCVFRHDDHAQNDSRHVYEERIVLVVAKDFNEAIENAEREAAEYCSAFDQTECLAFASAFEISEASIGELVEVYSLMRKSNLDDEDYLSAYFDTGNELQQKRSV